MIRLSRIFPRESMIDLTRGLNIHRLSLCELTLSFPISKISQPFLFWRAARTWSEWWSDCKNIMLKTGHIFLGRWNIDGKEEDQDFIILLVKTPFHFRLKWIKIKLMIAIEKWWLMGEHHCCLTFLVLFTGYRLTSELFFCTNSGMYKIFAFENESSP